MFLVVNNDTVYYTTFHQRIHWEYLFLLKKFLAPFQVTCKDMFVKRREIYLLYSQKGVCIYIYIYIYILYSILSLLTRNTYVYKNIRLYFYFWWCYLCGAEKQLQRVRAYKGVVGRQKSQWTTDFSQNSGTYIVYNSHVTCSSCSFTLVMVTPTSHFFVFHWLQFTSMFSCSPSATCP